MIVTLKNGIRVANFSSPHTFTFDDGSVLDAQPPEIARMLMLEAVEATSKNEKGWTDVSLSFKMTAEVAAVLDAWQNRDDVDIIIVPLPVMSALKEAGMDIGKCRVCRVADRVTKTIRSDAFCV